MPSKRKLLALLSLELLLYTLLYFMALLTAFMTMRRSSGVGAVVFMALLILGPPMLYCVRNVLRILKLKRNLGTDAATDSRRLLAIKLMAGQSAAILITPVFGALALLLTGSLGIVGLIVAAGIGPDAPAPPLPAKNDKPPPT